MVYNCAMDNIINAAGVIFENKNGEILVLKRNKDVPEGSTWGLTGGSLNDGLSPKDAVIKKVFAEIGYLIDKDKLVFEKEFHWIRSDMEIYFSVFMQKVSEGEVMPELDLAGNVSYKWETPVELYKRKDLMEGLYPILEDLYHTKK